MKLRATHLALFATLGWSLACLGIGNKGDEEEGAVGTDPLASMDSDNDGLSDADEQMLGTDPESADTDGDGWEDGVEVDGNTDPLKKKDHPYTGGWPIDACRHDIEATGNGLGDIAEDFALTDQFGDTVHLHDFCGKGVLLVSAAFW